MKKHLTFIYTLLVALFGCNSNDSMPMEPQASNGKPVYLGGCTSWSLEGHAWVLDGYLLRRENGTEREYYHINWGWNGARDGYYFCGTFDTTCGRFKDSNIDANTNLDKGGCESNYTWTYRMVTYDL